MRRLTAALLFSTSLATGLMIMLPLAITGGFYIYDPYPVIRWAEFGVCVVCMVLGIVQVVRECHAGR